LRVGRRKNKEGKLSGNAPKGLSPRLFFKSFFGEFGRKSVEGDALAGVKTGLPVPDDAGRILSCPSPLPSSQCGIEKSGIFT
jgi:hypothetical protein